MLQLIIDLINNPVISSLFGAVIGFIASFFAQDWLEERKFKRTLKTKAWEKKVETLGQFSEDLELWLYLTIRDTNQQWDHNSTPRVSGKIEELRQKLIMNKSYLLRYPNILSQYERLLELTERDNLSPIYLDPEEIKTSRSLLKTVQGEIHNESRKLSL